MTLHSLKRLASVSLSPDVKARHASQGDGRELQLPVSAVVLSQACTLL